ncbi:restriction endonuclease subunit S [Vibrio parahaemolyticus]|uniref:restriction endonuclease subunit S n=1 Tax=Vibrio parahaemolyticus TaxID=670 RepID=UPI00232AB1B1|nr:restriction endonuclease subunit S [Vibrio parahaemolyticus]MDB6192018.1 restriction endonuclease subunit S [Vibrio parahaemolyticus]MDF4332718.1 restriction endonuclease subunit S [Vibrio parahaemolyticus]
MVPNGWVKTTFGKITKIGNGQVDPKVEPYSSMTHIGPENVVSNTGQITNLKSCSDLGLISGKYEFDENSIVYSKIRPNLNKVCRPDFKGVCSADMYPIWSEDNLDINYLYHYMLGPYFNRIAIAMSMRTGMPKINRSDLNSLSIVLPPLTEQRKIAQILSTWDKAITTTEKLIDASKQQKKALMQQLLTGKKRLGCAEGTYTFKKTRYGSIPTDWAYPAIKDIAVQKSEKNNEGLDLPVLSCSKYDGFVDSLKYFKKKVYSDDTSGYRIISKGCFGFPANHIEEGSIGLQNLYEKGIVSPIYVVFQAKKDLVENRYLYALLKTDHYRQIFSAATNASVDRRGSLRWKEFSAIHVSLPPLEEQKAIADVLELADKETKLLEAKLAHLKQEKKALMQQLLTGKRRVSLSS